MPKSLNVDKRVHVVCGERVLTGIKPCIVESSTITDIVFWNEIYDGYVMAWKRQG